MEAGTLSAGIFDDKVTVDNCTLYMLMRAPLDYPRVLRQGMRRMDVQSYSIPAISIPSNPSSRNHVTSHQMTMTTQLDSDPTYNKYTRHTRSSGDDCTARLAMSLLQQKNLHKRQTRSYSIDYSPTTRSINEVMLKETCS